MKKSKIFCFLALMLMIFAFAPAVFAQEHELALLVARLKPSDRSLRLTDLIVTPATFDGAVTYQVNYANRVVNGEVASLHLEFAVTGVPRTGVNSSNVLLSRTYSTLIFTPGLKLKVFPSGFFSPYVAGGVGLGHFSSSDTNIAGGPVTGDRSNTSYVFNFGGGVDLRVIGPLSIRGEVRDFMTGTPSFSSPFLNDRQHNLFTGAGIVLRF